MEDKRFVIKNGRMLDYAEEKQKFLNKDIAFRSQYNNDFDEYCQESMYAVTGDICSPSEYVEKAELPVDIKDDISIAEFDEAIADEYGYWNYCLEDASETVENELTVIPVKFSDGTIRLVEMPE